MRKIETDYLVVGAGASGMAFVDALIADSNADVVMVDRRHRPGGHWNDDYPFVRLHQPSAVYGVNSRVLGSERIDESGPGAGFYERATAAEICDYYARVLDEQFLPTGRVRFFGMHDYIGADGHEIRSRLTGETTTVAVRRKLVDATYMEPTIPTTHTPPFSIDEDVRLVTPNDLVELTDTSSGYTVIGAGKTAMDTCCWLLDNGVSPEAIRWIRPRDPWVFDRAGVQPLELMDSLVATFATLVGAAAEAEDTADLCHRAEAGGAMMRLDPDVEPETFRGATLSEGEVAALRRITDVVRLGRVRHIGADQIELDEGSISTDADHVHVDCTASGIGSPPPCPVFDPDRITIQRIQLAIDPFSSALIGHAEAVRSDDEEKNRICAPVNLTGEARDFPNILLTSSRNQMGWLGDPDLAEWFNSSRLNWLRGADQYLSPEGQAALGRLFGSLGPAMENLERLVAPDQALASTRRMS